MEIKKDIAAKLSAVMKQRELNVTEFSKELGIARSSLVQNSSMMALSSMGVPPFSRFFEGPSP